MYITLSYTVHINVRYGTVLLVMDKKSLNRFTTLFCLTKCQFPDSVRPAMGFSHSKLGVFIILQGAH